MVIQPAYSFPLVTTPPASTASATMFPEDPVCRLCNSIIEAPAGTTLSELRGDCLEFFKSNPNAISYLNRVYVVPPQDRTALDNIGPILSTGTVPREGINEVLVTEGTLVIFPAAVSKIGIRDDINLRHSDIAFYKNTTMGVSELTINPTSSIEHTPAPKTLISINGSISNIHFEGITFSNKDESEEVIASHITSLISSSSSSHSVHNLTVKRSHFARNPALVTTNSSVSDVNVSGKVYFSHTEFDCSGSPSNTRCIYLNCNRDNAVCDASYLDADSVTMTLNSQDPNSRDLFGFSLNNLHHFNIFRSNFANNELYPSGVYSSRFISGSLRGDRALQCVSNTTVSQLPGSDNANIAPYTQRLSGSCYVEPPTLSSSSELCVQVATTESPTTELSTTESPTTELSTTDQVTTESPTTEQVTTESPTTEATTVKPEITDSTTAVAVTTGVETTTATVTTAATADAKVTTITPSPTTGTLLSSKLASESSSSLSSEPPVGMMSLDMTSQVMPSETLLLPDSSSSMPLTVGDSATESSSIVVSSSEGVEPTLSATQTVSAGISTIEPSSTISFEGTTYSSSVSSVPVASETPKAVPTSSTVLALINTSPVMSTPAAAVSVAPTPPKSASGSVTALATTKTTALSTTPVSPVITPSPSVVVGTGNTGPGLVGADDSGIGQGGDIAIGVGVAVVAIVVLTLIAIPVFYACNTWSCSGRQRTYSTAGTPAIQMLEKH
ncbi:hypothetical protein [Endozoicomonas sp. OPT23]|uniref:hypothetical protein n=1 Tax=Endozoicomonas sp. OPT23 TaxID=2072845 RepID=UPI00129AC27B|nr:hypothetical protein [Endozoicomonas sp. OPT23]